MRTGSPRSTRATRTTWWRGDANEAFDWLDRALSNRDTSIEFLLFDPFILRYKDDPGFAAFCRKVGLPTPAEVAARRT